MVDIQTDMLLAWQKKKKRISIMFRLLNIFKLHSYKHSDIYVHINVYIQLPNQIHSHPPSSAPSRSPKALNQSFSALKHPLGAPSFLSSLHSLSSSAVLFSRDKPLQVSQRLQECDSRNVYRDICVIFSS